MVLATTFPITHLNKTLTFSTIVKYGVIDLQITG